MLAFVTASGLNLAVAVAVMVFVWILSLRLRDVSIVDIAWGGVGAGIAFFSFLAAGGSTPRRILITSMVILWGIRLALHIGIRKKGSPEDFRYAAMRAEHGSAFPLRSLFTIFLLQAFLIWVVTLPVQVTQLAAEPAHLGFLDLAGGLVWLVGFAWESVADLQLARFLSDPANRGKVMDRGLWAFSRHPNYFGEVVLWWGAYLVALSTPWAWVTIVSPILVTYLLMNLSGVPLLEDALLDRRAGYREYVERTNAFFPWPPRAR
jgi:steroid 5-alpha reductase family enzyme